MQILGITDKRWKCAEEITQNPRALKRKVQEFNNHFGEDAEHTMYIVSGSNGYKLSNDKDEIMQAIGRDINFAKDRMDRAKDRMANARKYFSKNLRLPI